MVRTGFAEVFFLDWGCLTRFEDGKEARSVWPTVPGLLHDDYAAVAHRLGYEYDLRRYCQEHDVAHLVIEEALHARPSRVLWGLAHGDPLSPQEAAYEELAAQSLQRFCRANERPIIGSVDWDAMRNQFLVALELNAPQR